MGLLPASLLVLVAMIGCSFGAENNKPTECANVVVSGFIANPNTAEKGFYFWCHAGTKQGVKVTCVPSGYQWNNDLQTCVPKQYNEAITMCSVKLGAVSDGSWQSPCTTSVKQKTGTTCTLKCNDGFRVINEDNRNDQSQPIGMGDTTTVTCNRQSGQSSRWTKDVGKFKCVSKCLPNPCGFGTCALKGANIECTCRVGWLNTNPSDKGTPCLTTKNNCQDKTCSNKGFCINGLAKHTCQCENGYSGDACQTAVTCPKLTLKDGATADPVQASDAAYNAKVTLKCTEGNFVTGWKLREMELTCSQSGKYVDGSGKTFEDANAACVKINCDTPSVVGGTPALTTTGVTTFQATASLVCNSGYELLGSGYSCRADGTWGPQTCKPKDCGAFTAPAYSKVAKGSGTTFESERTITCDNSFQVSAGVTTATLKCEASGSWAAFSGCIITDCGSPKEQFDQLSTGVKFAWIGGDITNGVVPQNKKVQLTCESNSMLIGGDSDNKLTCGPGGWTPIEVKAKCVANDKCPTTYTMVATSGTVAITNTNGGEPNGAPVTTEMKITCKDGHEIKNLPQRHKDASFLCKKTGDKVQWEAKPFNGNLPISPAPVCAPVSCPTLTNPANGKYEKLEGAYKDEVLLTCGGERVAVPSGTTKLTCGADTKWTPDPVTVKCEEVSCPKIPFPDGIVMKEGSTDAATDFTIGGSFTFKCNEDFKLSEAADYKVSCGKKTGDSKEGVYSKTLPTCSKINDCFDSGNKVDCGQGVCEDLVGKYKCNCNAGYSGEKCDTQTDPCAGKPCGVNGECQTNPNYTPGNTKQNVFKCNCKPNTRYSGDTCLKDNQITPTKEYCTSLNSQLGVKYKDPTSCKKYVTCDFNKLPTSTACSTSDNFLVFDFTTNKCVKPESATKESLCTVNYNI